MAEARARAAKALRELGKPGPPMAQLDAARRLREAADLLEQEAVDAARAGKHTWTEIGSVYGLSKQAAQQRFRTKPLRPAGR